MPNGRLGDNPVTDVVYWNREVFGPETDALIREIDAFTDDDVPYDPFDEVGDVLWKAEADRSKTPELHDALVQLLARLRGEGKRPRPT